MATMAVMPVAFSARSHPCAVQWPSLNRQPQTAKPGSGRRQLSVIVPTPHAIHGNVPVAVRSMPNGAATFASGSKIPVPWRGIGGGLANHAESGKERPMLGTVLLVVLVLVLLGAMPTWPHSRSWGYMPSGVLGLLLIVVLVLVLMGRL